MKRSFMILSLIIMSVFIASVNANADIVSFGDTSKYWLGWGNGSRDDSKDVIGMPNFTGGHADITSGLLTSLTFNRAAGTSSYWGVISPGDLFIDTNADQRWDYVVDLSAWGTSGPNNSDPLAGNYNIYSLNLALNDASGYILSGADNTGDWSGSYIRDGHPVAAIVDGLNVSGSAEFSGWGDGSTTEYYFNFDSLNLGGSGNFTIGWQPNCANDVVYETVRYHTPEPATMSLLGLGLAGLLGFRKRRA